MQISDIDKIFSRYIRLREADDCGLVRCYTCGKMLFWKQAECGHYIPRQHMTTRFDKMNCHAQCFTCNHEKRGNLEAYRAHLVEEFGEAAVAKLESMKFKEYKFVPSELIELNKILKKDMRNILESKGL